MSARTGAGDIAWRPSEQLVRECALTRFIEFLGLPDYRSLERLAEEDPDRYWDGMVRFNDFRFFKPYTAIRDASGGPAWTRWFIGGTTNFTLNCLDKWRGTPTYRKTAIVFEDETGSHGELTYAELDEEVCRLAQGLRSLGLGRGDAVAIYLPTSPEAAIAFLAIVKIGAMAQPMFSGFGVDAVRVRLRDSSAKAVVTVDGTWRRGRRVAMKPVLDEAARDCPDLVHMIVRRRAGVAVAMQDGRDRDWNDLIAAMPTESATEEMDASDPMMMIYTSGTTGKPKGIVQTHAGFPNKVALDFAIFGDFRTSDRILWMSDMGWIVGPLLVSVAAMTGGTMVLVEGAPNAPEPDRFWRLVSDYRVSYLGVAPTIIRTLMANGEKQLEKHDLTCLRAFGSTGEAWTPEAWRWLFEKVGKSRLPIMNVSGGTEMIAILGCTVIHPLKPCGFSVGLPGVNPAVYDEGGNIAGPGEIGELVMRSACMGLTQSLWRDDERYIESYWSMYPGVWRHGDYASRDADGFWYIHGRSDDVMKIAGKRTSPSEVETLVLETGKFVEAAAVGVADPVKGQAIVCVCVLRDGVGGDGEALKTEIADVVAAGLGKPFRPKEVIFVRELPKTRNMKILRRVVRAVCEGQDPGDLSSLGNPEAVAALQEALAHPAVARTALAQGLAATIDYHKS